MRDKTTISQKAKKVVFVITFFPRFMLSEKYRQRLDDEERADKAAFLQKCKAYAEELEMEADEFNHQSAWYPCLRVEQSYAEVRQQKKLDKREWIINYFRRSEPKEYASLSDSKEYRCKLLGQRCTRIENHLDGCTKCLVPLHDEKLRNLVVTIEDVIQ